MKGRRDRIGAVLKVRELQEQQAAMAVARAVQAAREAEHELARLHDHYDEHRGADRTAGVVPEVLDERQRRTFQAGAIVHGRSRVARARDELAREQAVLVERSQAVRGLEKLDESLAATIDDDARRDAQRAVDDLTTSAHVRGGR